MVEQPKYGLIKQDGKIEIREYSKYVIAKTSIKQTDTNQNNNMFRTCLLYTSPSPRDGLLSRMPSSA